MTKQNPPASVKHRSRLRRSSVRVRWVWSCAAAIALVAGACQPQQDKPALTGAVSSTMPAAAAASPAITQAALLPPALDNSNPTDYPGLLNVVTYAKDVYCGAVPEGDAGFDTLKAFGIRTIISVDGAAPDIEPAKIRGIRYVHLPITYDGMTEGRKLEIARAVRDLPRPIYVHCHHGKHRSAAAAASAAVSLGYMTPEQAVAKMKISGTDPGYKGLYTCAASSAAVLPAVLDAVSNKFPEVDRPAGLKKTMVEIDDASDNLKLIQKAGWQPPKASPDLVPAAEAGRLADHFRALKEDIETKKRPPEFVQWLAAESGKVEQFEAGLTAQPMAPKDDLDKRWTTVQQSCKQCHVKYRD